MTVARLRRHPVLLGAAVVVLGVLCGLLFTPHGGTENSEYLTSSVSYTVRLRVGPATAGDSTIDVAVNRRDGAAVDVDRVTLEVAMPAMGHALPPVSADARGPGRFRVRAHLFGMAGDWQVRVRLHSPRASESAEVTVSGR